MNGGHGRRVTDMSQQQYKLIRGQGHKVEGHRCPREVKGQRVQNDENGTQHRASLERERVGTIARFNPAKPYTQTAGWQVGVATRRRVSVGVA